ncbi:MAG: BON domain-containing protein [Alphaproteobacteria bacterium]|nr:BON domain-containing protein [Alphaproteobacteria bacterium]
METDAAIRADVAEELDFDPSIHSDGVGVAVKNGVVTLSGHVPSYAEKIAAVKAAERVRGVKAVAQDIVVRLPFDNKQDDDEIAARAVNVLKWSVGGMPDLKVAVDSGWVPLEGKATWYFQKKGAERSIRQLTGVVGVTNNILVRPAVLPSAVKQNIAKAFKRNADLESSAIKVDVDGSSVTLSGKITAWHERKMAEDAAWAIPGVSEVHDNLTL